MKHAKKLGCELVELTQEFDEFHEYDMDAVAPIIEKMHAKTHAWLKEYREIRDVIDKTNQ